MDGSILKFLLVPDGSAARRVRRVLAERSAPRSGIMVGNWQLLMKRAHLAYLVPELSKDEDNNFRCALKEFKSAFWAESLSVAPVETGKSVKSALIEIISATDPTSDIAAPGSETLSDRPRQHLNDLFGLAESLEGRLPAELLTMQSLLSASPDNALHHIRVYLVKDVPYLTRWQAELIKKLNRDAKAGTSDERRDNVLTQTLEEVLIRDFTGEPDGSLGTLQKRLFQVVKDKSKVDKSVQWVGTRDFLQEAEVAAGMVQTMLAENRKLMRSDIGLLIPDSFEYTTALEDAFSLAGIALSGLPAKRWRRDLARELVFHFLYCRQKPAPAMALAICLSSPLMPWSHEEGAVLAQTVMDGDYQLHPPPSINDSHARNMLGLLRKGDSKPALLKQALLDLLSLIRDSKNSDEHVQQATVVVKQLCESLENITTIDWGGLRRTVSPTRLTPSKPPDFNLEGVSVWQESKEPWRPVKHLIVLGFSQGRYPSAPVSDPVFSADDLAPVRKSNELPVSSPSEILERRRQRFKQQLGAVTESVTFLVPRRDPRGKEQAPSESLVFMHQLFTGPESANERILELDSADDRKQVRHLVLAPSESPKPPRVLCTEDLQFDRDLLTLRTDTEGTLKPESPSSLETLMISSLAWLLQCINVKPRLWAPESANMALLGTLAHKVFEDLFRPGEDLPEQTEIPKHVETLLDKSIQHLAPFLKAPQWQMEQKNFENETIKAARAWLNILKKLDAKVLANEASLQGNCSGTKIHGQPDLIMGLSKDRLLVVDYKWSSSRNLLKRMEKGYDSQASLYRMMLKSGKLESEGDAILVTNVRKAVHTGILYYVLKDQVSLSNLVIPESNTVPGWQTLKNDVASEAMERIQKRLEEVKAGKVCRNQDGDAKFFEKQAGINPYVLKNNPLIDLFTVRDT